MKQSLNRFDAVCRKISFQKAAVVVLVREDVEGEASATSLSVELSAKVHELRKKQKKREFVLHKMRTRDTTSVEAFLESLE